MSETRESALPGWPWEQTAVVTLVVSYLATGWLGFQFAYGHPAVSLVWPPAGIALGALLVWGYRVWLPVAGASALLYAATVGPSPAVVLLAAGNTAEAVLAAYLINRYAGGRLALQTPRHSLRFAALVVLAGTTVGATVTTTTLVAAGLAPGLEFSSIWATASLGNITGSILLAPAVLLFSQGIKTRFRTVQVVEACVIQLVVLLIGLIAFCGFVPSLRGYPLELLCVPVLLWVALRVGRHAAVAAVLVLTVLALYGTITGYGPFVRDTPTMGIVVSQIFMSVVAVMTISLATLASEFAWAEAQLRELVVTDPLTGLPNYRRLIEVLDREIERANRTKEAFAVVFFDMDDLKSINDELGHLVGSRAVCRLADTLRAVCRTTDTPARYGGDEFVTVLPDTDAAGAEIMIHRMAERLAQDPDEPALSVSAGVAVYPQDGRTATTLLSAADRTLYAAKAAKAIGGDGDVVPIRDWTRTRSS
jgi:diguanylate cyclase (GGDEF)-like protein